MRKPLFMSANLANRQYFKLQLLIDSTLFATVFLPPNILMALSFMNSVTDWLPRHETLSVIGKILISVEELDATNIFFWSLANLILGTFLLSLRRHVFCPVYGVARQIQGMANSMEQESASAHITVVSMRTIAGDLSRMAQIAQDYYIKHRDANQALMQARDVIDHISVQQQTILNSTSREMITQYQSVLAYANYLEERIAKKAASPDLRYDFDEVSESSFKLKLIAGALHLLQNWQTHELTRLDMTQLMEQTMLTLAPSLDRRAMKLTTVEVDLHVIAKTDPTIVAHVLWMLLLGTIRYAADESTLRLRCLYNRDRSRTLLSIVISELSPGSLSEEERGAFLERQSQHLTPHMFAETIRIQANMQLAQMLISRLGGQITIMPLTTYSCEICLNLPASA